MRNLVIVLSLLILSSCGAMGIGKNEKVTVVNNSPDPIVVQGQDGNTQIAPNTSSVINEDHALIINSRNKNCTTQFVERQTNTLALTLDVFPGFFLGMLPLLVDMATDNVNEMPETYNYSCRT